MKIGYLFSRYPVLSQTFCDTEMLELERLGFSLEIGSIHPPLTSFRHEHAARLQAAVHYAPPQSILRLRQAGAEQSGRWPSALIADHTGRFGVAIKASQRARNALFFADLFTELGIDHLHVHFANRAAHTALFIKQLSGIPFSITAHGQDFMTDLNNDPLLREICREAEFIAAETDYSSDLLRQRCPESAGKIQRVYNGMNLENFPRDQACQWSNSGPVRIISVGRLIEFKGFNYLIAACGKLQQKARDFTCEIIGEGPLRESLQKQIAEHNLDNRVRLTGALTQQQIFQKLRDADIFSLACVQDRAGASDVFPTVILEAMASGRPVVSTRMAGVPESIVHGQTGLLAAPADVSGLVDALDALIQNSELRQQLGSAGRARVETNFRVSTTILPLKELFEKQVRPGAPKAPPAKKTGCKRIAYLIDTWPDASLPNLHSELAELSRHGIPIELFVCEAPLRFARSPNEIQMAPQMTYLPDASVLEAEWRQERDLAGELEETRNDVARDVPAALFYRQARFALGWRRKVEAGKIRHVHATSSTALVGAFLLQRMSDITISASLEPGSVIPRSVLDRLVACCAGGRIPDRKMSAKLSSSFMYDGWTFSKIDLAKRALAALPLVDLTGRKTFWQDWSERLIRWSRQNDSLTGAQPS